MSDNEIMQKVFNVWVNNFKQYPVKFDDNRIVFEVNGVESNFKVVNGCIINTQSAQLVTNEESILQYLSVYI